MPENSNITPWVVLKFGGTSVSQKHRWDTIGRLIRERAEQEQVRVLVVVSALVRGHQSITEPDRPCRR